MGFISITTPAITLSLGNLYAGTYALHLSFYLTGSPTPSIPSSASSPNSSSNPWSTCPSSAPRSVSSPANISPSTLLAGFGGIYSKRRESLACKKNTPVELLLWQIYRFSCFKIHCCHVRMLRLTETTNTSCMCVWKSFWKPNVKTPDSQGQQCTVCSKKNNSELISWWDMSDPILKLQYVSNPTNRGKLSHIML